MNTESLTAEKADMFEEGNIEDITRMMQNRKKNLLWWQLPVTKRLFLVLGVFLLVLLLSLSYLLAE